MANAILNGLLLGGMYALMAMGLTLQYGVARIMNLAYGDFLIAASFAAYWLFIGWSVNPIVALLLVVPVNFGVSWVVYSLLLTPLVDRAKSRDQLEVDSLLATFGLLFVIQGVVLMIFGGAYYSYSFLSIPVPVLGATLSANRILAFAIGLLLALALYLAMTRTRTGTAIRAVAVDPVAAQLVAIDVRKAAAFAFALGGALVAAAGLLISMFITFSGYMGVQFALKALIVVIMAGVGNLLGCLIAGMVLGLVESLVASFVDPGLTLAASFTLFLAVLLVKPTGLFGAPRR
jgi:branched-chain amino acid transport system permease protein